VNTLRRTVTATTIKSDLAELAALVDSRGEHPHHRPELVGAAIRLQRDCMRVVSCAGVVSVVQRVRRCLEAGDVTGALVALAAVEDALSSTAADAA
jgi:hypothetical protein